MHIPSHAIKVVYVWFSEYLWIKNCMALQSLHHFFYYHNKYYLNSMKCWEIGMGPYICTNQCSSFIKLEQCPVFVQRMEVSQNSQTCPPIGRGGICSRWGFVSERLPARYCITVHFCMRSFLSRRFSCFHNLLVLFGACGSTCCASG
jgi:hypothetical protein